jgi:uroporphyrinogen decarboxylase
MKSMSTFERIACMFRRKEADRIPIFDIPWETTLEKWKADGMPRDADYVDYFELDRTVLLWQLDSSPRYEEKIIEETDQYRMLTTRWGATQKCWKHAESTPECLDFIIKNPDQWRLAKERIFPSPDRIPMEYLKENYPKWRKNGAWIQAYLWFGFDLTHSHMVGTERLLMALIEEPAWCLEMFNHLLETNIALFDMLWDAGFKFDAVFWPDDLGYKNKQFFSVETYRQLLKPVHKRAIEWAHSKGAKAIMHSCGDVNPFIPELIDIGLDGLNPLEVKAGMNPLELKQKFGKDLLLYGGINAVLWDDMPEMEKQMNELIPMLKKNGGYIFSSDHSVPSSVSLKNFRHIVDLAKNIGRY